MIYSHVLISRPGPEAAELAGMVRDMAMEPVQMPAFRFEPNFAGLDFNNAWLSGQRRLLVFSSPRAVEFGLRQLPAGFLDDVEIAAIGPATANALESAGHTVSILPLDEFNSDALLEHPALFDQAGKALIFAAPGGRQSLFAGLENLGWSVEFAHVYQTVPLDPSPGAVEAIMQAGTVLSIWTSANALRHLSKILLPQAWEKISRGDFIVISERLKKIANSYTDGQVHVTDGPGNATIRDCIVQMI